MTNYQLLLDYIDARAKGGPGWRDQVYEPDLPVTNWPRLAGHYTGLLDTALLLIPPGVIEMVRDEQNRHETEQDDTYDGD